MLGGQRRCRTGALAQSARGKPSPERGLLTMEPDTTIRSRNGPVVVSRGQSMRRRLLLLASVALKLRRAVRTRWPGEQRGGHCGHRTGAPASRGPREKENLDYQTEQAGRAGARAASWRGLDSERAKGRAGRTARRRHTPWALIVRGEAREARPGERS